MKFSKMSNHKSCLSLFFCHFPRKGIMINEGNILLCHYFRYDKSNKTNFKMEGLLHRSFLPVRLKQQKRSERQWFDEFANFAFLFDLKNDCCL